MVLKKPPAMAIAKKYIKANVMFKFCFKNFTYKHRHLVVWVLLFAVSIQIVTASEIYRSHIKNGLLFASSITFTLLICSAVIISKRRFKNYRLKLASVLTLVYATAICFGIIYPIAYGNIRYGNILSFEGETSTIYGVAASEPTVSSSGSSIGIEVKTLYIKSDNRESEKAERIMLYLPNSPKNANIKSGSEIYFTAGLNKPVKKISNFNYRNYLMSRGCAVTAQTGACEFYEADKNTAAKFMKLSRTTRAKVKEYTENILSDSDEQALLQGILLGIKDSFSNELMNDMSDSGLMHIAAVSGLHIMFLSTVLAFLLKLFGRRLRSIIIIIVLFVFAYIADFTPSVLRAVIMVSVILLGNILMRDADAVTSLFFAAFVLLLCNPYILYSAGFLLSFSATLSILIYLKPMSVWGKFAADKLTDKIYNDKLKLRCNRTIRYFLEVIIVPLSCQILICPVSAYIFDKISLAAIILNIIVIPCTMIIFVAGLFNFALYLLVPAAAKFIGFVMLHIPLAIIRICAEKAADMPLKIVPLQTPGIITFVVYAFLCMVLYYVLAFYGEKRLKLLTNSKTIDKY